MNTTSTAIAVGLAVVVVGVIFIFPGLSPFNFSQPESAPAAAVAPVATSSSSLVPITSSTTTMQNVTQLEVTDQTVGTGAAAEPGDQVTVNYIGQLTDGTVFDASANHGSTGFTFTLGTNAPQVIPGWDQGIVGMKVGGTRELVIPPSLAYGAQGISGVIPPNATLVFPGAATEHYASVAEINKYN